MSTTTYRAEVVRSIVELLQILGVTENTELLIHVRRGYLNSAHGNVVVAVDADGNITIKANADNSLADMRLRDLCRLLQALRAELGKRVHLELNAMRDAFGLLLLSLC